MLCHSPLTGMNPHIPGSGERCLVVCCGAAPAGTVQLAHMSVGLTTTLRARLDVQVRLPLKSIG